jgi:hypothetical protein
LRRYCGSCDQNGKNRPAMISAVAQPRTIALRATSHASIR